MITIKQLLSIPTDWLHFLSYTTARSSVSLQQSCSHLGYKITQLHSAAGMQTFSIINITLSKPEMNTRHTKLPAMCNARMTPKVTSFPDGDTSNIFLDFWHYSISFMAFLSNVEVAVLHNRHSLSMQWMPCHKEKWRMCPKHTVCPPAKHRKNRVSFQVTSMGLQLPFHIMGNHCSDLSQQNFHPHFYWECLSLIINVTPFISYKCLTHEQLPHQQFLPSMKPKKET